MEMKKVRLGDICSKICSGGTPLSKNTDYYNPPVIPWLTTSEVNYSRIYSTEKYISENGLNNSSAKLIPENSVIIAMYGQGKTAGRVAINKIPVATNQACCNLIINPKIADFQYVYYALSAMYNDLIVLKSGGAQPNLNAKKIKEFEIPYPSINAQHIIASILSAYDDMIDNCKRQIALLEEAAQRIYINEIRQSTLEKTILSSIIKFKSGFAFKSSSFTTNGRYRLITIKNVKDGIFDETNFSYIEELPPRIPSHCKLSNGDIVMSLTGDVARCCFVIGDNNLLNQRVAKIETVYPNFSYLFLRDYKVHSILCNIANGAAQQNLSPIRAENEIFEMPSILRIEEINLIVSPYIEKLKNVNNIMQNLKYSRNILLPRLISGQIEINA